MGNPQADAAFPPIDKVLLIQQVDDVKPEQHFLSVPGQRNRVRDRGIVHGIGILVRGIRLRALFGRSQPRAVEHLTRNVCALPETIAEDG